MIHKTMIELKQHIGFFYKLCEDIARLDMIQSLAEASKRGNYVRPKFGEFTELSQARHPMLEWLIGEKRVSNSISTCKDFNIHIITGPNGSGKSIYIRQVMLLQVMAQVGSYVPADSAIFRPMSRMFARIYLEDNMEYGASAFILEMKEVKYMMTLLSENSLFIIDELCRSTAADEGTALAMAVCEKFCNTSVFLYVTTHYTELTNLANMYFNVKTWQMETVSYGETPQELNLNYKYKLTPGVTILKHYGVYIVKSIWPQSILDEVYRILNSLKSTTSSKEIVRLDKRIKLKYNLESDLRKLKSRKKLTDAVINKLLNEYQNELQKLGIFIHLIQENSLLNMDNENDGDEAPEELNISMDGNTCFETSSYLNLSNFLREDSDNINKLIPEVSIACSEREFNAPSFGFQRNKIMSSLQNSLEEISPFDANKSQTQNQNTENNHKLLSPSVQTLWGADLDKFDYDVESILEDLESCSEQFFDDQDFDFSQASSYHTAVSNHQEEVQNQHIIPIVTVVNGPDWISTSSQDEDLSLESISYSPLYSPSSKEPTTTSSSSSLHYISKSRGDFKEVSVNGVTTTDTNLDNISISRDLDNITIENLKSNSCTTVDKPSSKSDEATSSSVKESDKSNEDDPKAKIKQNKKMQKIKLSSSSSQSKRFIPPRKLTKREIEEEFQEQDRRVYETDITDSNFSKYLSRILKRPSVKQVRESKHLAFVRRTQQGVEVFPAAPEPSKRPKINPFKRNLSNSTNVDVSIFSDQNAKSFNAFLNSNETQFKFNLGTHSHQTGIFNFQPQTISEYAAAENLQFSFKSRKRLSQNVSENVQSLECITPDGFYKENKEDINKIVNKYLRNADGPQRVTNENPFNEGNMFETASFNGEDLEL